MKSGHSEDTDHDHDMKNDDAHVGITLGIQKAVITTVSKALCQELVVQDHIAKLLKFFNGTVGAAR